MKTPLSKIPLAVPLLFLVISKPIQGIKHRMKKETNFR